MKQKVLAETIVLFSFLVLRFTLKGPTDMSKRDIDPKLFYSVASKYVDEAKIIFAHVGPGLPKENISSYTDNGVNYSWSQIDETHPTYSDTGSLYFILGHAIELYLKTLLIIEGNDSAVLKKIGHNLEKAIASLKSNELTDTCRHVIDAFSEQHANLVYRYPEHPQNTIPIPEVLFEVADELKSLVDGMICL